MHMAAIVMAKLILKSRQKEDMWGQFAKQSYYAINFTYYAPDFKNYAHMQKATTNYADIMYTCLIHVSREIRL